MPDGEPRYRGRFAPSPTGDLHFGSLIAAMASYCDARWHGGVWRLRIEDIDPPRARPGAAEQIPRSLIRFGFHWDGAIQWQSAHADRHRQALHELNQRHRLYLCHCTRRQLAGHAHYPGTCRAASDDLKQGLKQGPDPLVGASIASDEQQSTAVRIMLNDNPGFTDAVFGWRREPIDDGTADVIVKRRDGRVAYHLACAVDDGIDFTHVVRGADLLDCTPPQIGIQQSLGHPSPTYLHVPLAIRADGSKLSKHTHARAIDEWPALPLLIQAWEFLGQTRCKPDSISDFWAHACSHWQREHIPVCTAQIQAID